MRFRSLDGWRGIAAVFVSLYHLDFYNHLYNWDFLRNSYLFVDFFFVLSGFVISHAYLNRLSSIKDAYTFIYRRISRLLPLHLFILLLFIGLELLKLILLQSGSWDNSIEPFTKEYSPASLISNIFLLQSLGFHDTLTWNYPSWSISVEFYTYLVFAVVIGLSRKNRNLKLIQYFILIAISLFLLYENTENLNHATFHYGIFRCIVGFFLGSICYQLFLTKKHKKIYWASAIEVLLLIGIYFFVTYSGNNKSSILAPLIFAGTVFIFSYEQGLISRLLKTESIQNLGKWSYSIYMLHALIILIIGRGFKLIDKFSDQQSPIEYILSSKTNLEITYISNLYVMDLLTTLYLFVLVFLASYTYKYIELKGNNYLNNIFKKDSRLI